MEGMLRDARSEDLPAIVAIYNAWIPGRMATADTEPVSVDSRREWLRQHAPGLHPLWVLERGGQIAGWLSLGPFYGRPAYAATAELSVYVAPEQQRKGIAAHLVGEAVRRAPGLGLTTLLGFVFAHNAPSLSLLAKFGFAAWGRLPRVALLDGVERDLVILGLRVA